MPVNISLVRVGETIILDEAFDMQGGSSRILDLLYLVVSALLVCAVGVGAFVFAETHHFNPLWVFLTLASIGFFAGVAEEYRNKLRSASFVAFVCGWLFIHLIAIVVVWGSFGFLYLIPVLFLEQVLFYMTACWFFDVRPPSRQWPFQRAKSSDNNDL
jgi:hypothetical protein